jgi:hypothetical protein
MELAAILRPSIFLGKKQAKGTRHERLAIGACFGGSMTPRKLLVEQILPALARFKEGYLERDVGLGRDIARAADLADLLLNLPEYLIKDDSVPTEVSSYNSAREYRERYLWKQYPGYELVCDFANSWKHRKVTRDGRKMNGMEDVVEGIGACRNFDAAGAYYCQHKLVLIKTGEQSYAELRRLLVSVTDHLTKELARLGITPEVPPDTFAFGEFTSRQQASDLPPIRMRGFVGEPLAYRLQALDFDVERGTWIDSKAGSGFNLQFTMLSDIRPSPFARDSPAC